MQTRRRFLGQLAAGAALIAWRPAWAGATDVPMCRIVRPGDPDYDAARFDFNLRFDVHPRAILFACCTDDVVRAVRWARHHGVPLRARAGGHSYEAFSLVEDGLVIDLTPLAHVRVDADHRHAHFGAGITLGDVYERLWDAGRLALPGGSCRTVGLTGLTLGGGFGLLSRRRGLTCDDLVSAEMVTADGEVVRASADRHPELFWALRGGGGGNFGIVTELTFRVHPIGNVALASVTWPWAQLPDVIQGWLDWGPGIDRRLVSTTYFPPPGQRAGVFALLDGAPDELESLLEPLLEIGTPTLSVPTAMSWIDAARTLGDPLAIPAQMGAPRVGEKFKNSSAYLSERLPAEGIAVFVDQLTHAPGINLVQFDNYGGAIADHAPHATAFFHRDALASVQYQAYWTHDAEQAANVAWVNGFRTAMLPWTRGAYVNYIDADIADWPAQYYGLNFHRLRRVKRDWDPDEVFQFPQSIPPL